MHIKWKGAEEAYRKTLYTISYDALMNPYADVRPTLKNAEKKFLKLSILKLSPIYIDFCTMP